MTELRLDTIQGFICGAVTRTQGIGRWIELGPAESDNGEGGGKNRSRDGECEDGTQAALRRSCGRRRNVLAVAVLCLGVVSIRKQRRQEFENHDRRGERYPDAHEGSQLAQTR